MTFDVDESLHRQPYIHKLPQSHIAPVTAQLEDQIKRGILVPSDHHISHPILLVPKKDSKDEFEWRMCANLKALNKALKVPNHPMYIMDDLLKSVARDLFFSLDMLSGYFQLPIQEDHQKYTTISTPLGLYKYTVQPFGTSNGPQEFQMVMYTILKEVWDIIRSYLDDILGFALGIEHLCERLDKVLSVLSKYGIKCKLSKCHFGCKSIEWLGHTISAEGTKMQTEKVEALQKMATPTSVALLRSFNGMCTYYSDFIPDFSEVMSPLTAATSIKKGTEFVWTDEMEKAFVKIKALITENPNLRRPDWDKPFELYVDASGIAAGFCLAQEGGIIAYGSKKFNDLERKYKSYEQEAYAILLGLEHFKYYTTGREITIYSDMSSLKWLFSNEQIGRVARWCLHLAIYHFTIKYVKGTENPADCYSRLLPDEQQTPFEYDHQLGKDINTVDVQQQISPPKEAKLFSMTSKNYKIKPNTLFKLSSSNIQYIQNTLLYAFSKHERVQGKIKIDFGEFIWVSKKLHDESGHTRAIYERFMCRNFFYPSMRKEIQSYLGNCEVCFHASKPKYNNIKLTFPDPKECLGRIFMDVKPFPREYQKEGFVGILFIVDQTTRYVWGVNLKSMEVEMLIEIMHTFFKEVGKPKIAYSDSGTNFTSKQFTQFMRNKGVDFKIAPPRSHKTVGIVERQMREVNKYFIKNGQVHKWWMHTQNILDLLNNTPRQVLDWNIRNTD